MSGNGSKDKLLRIGIVGAGNIVLDRHLPGLREIGNVEITAVCNSTYESSTRFCERHLPRATAMKNWADLLMLPDLDIVWIGTPPYMHHTVAISAFEAGKHVFCQARMAMNAQEAEEMAEAARNNPHLVAMLCPPPLGMKFDAVFQRMLHEEDYVGKPHLLRLNSLGSQFIDPDAPAHWRQREEISGLNVLTLGIYAEVLQRWFGPIASVGAQTKIVWKLRQDYEVKIPDIVGVLCAFASGLSGSMIFSGVTAFAPEDRIEVYGDRGTLVYNFANDRIFAGRLGDKGLHEVKPPEDDEQPWQVERDFIEAVRHPDCPRPHPDFEDGLRYMRVVDAVAASARKGKCIDIELD